MKRVTTRNYFKIKTSPSCGRKENDMNKRDKGILIGMVLGDGYLRCRKDNRCKNYVQSSIIMKHCIKQKEYLEFKADLLHSIFGGKKPNVIECDNSGYPGCRTSKTNKYFKVLYELLYSNGKKTITREVLNYLNPLGLAIWYMDDGCLSAKKRNGKIHSYDLILNTYISYEDNQIIVDYLKEVWDVQFTIVKDKGKTRIRCGTREARKFIEIVKPYIVPCMQYKINISYPKSK